MLPRIVLDYENSNFSLRCKNWASVFLMDSIEDIKHVTLKASGGDSCAQIVSNVVYVTKTQILDLLTIPVSAYTLRALSPRLDFVTGIYISSTLQCFSNKYIRVENKRVHFGCNMPGDGSMTDMHKHWCVQFTTELE